MFLLDDDRLIENVRKHRELYDPAKKNYHDYRYRDALWRRISRDMNIPVKICKNRWITLRDQLRKALRKKNSTFEPVKKWRYEDAMAFLIPFFTHRKRKVIHLPEEADELRRFDFNDDECLKIQPYIYDTDTETDSDDETKIENFCAAQKENPPKGGNISLSPRTIIMHKNVKNPEKSKLPASLKRFMLQKQVPTNGVSNAMQIELFFDGIAATVKNFSPVYQSLAKKKIFSLVSKLEIEQLNNL